MVAAYARSGPGGVFETGVDSEDRPGDGVGGGCVVSAFHESVELEMELVVEYSLFTGSYIMEMRFGCASMLESSVLLAYSSAG